MSDTTVIFQIRAQNDWEHALPIIYKLSQRTKKIWVVLESDFTPKQPIPLRENVEFYILGQGGVQFPKLFSFFTTLKKSVPKSGLIFRVVNKVLRMLHHESLQTFKKKILNSNSDIVLCYDYGLHVDLQIPARKRVSLPHAVSNWKNKWTNSSMISPEQVKKPNWINSDLYIVCDEFQKKDLLSEIADEKTKILGSARFCPEWQSILPIPKAEKGSKRKILLLLSKPQMNYNYHEVWRMVRVLNQFSELELVIKAHTRIGDLDYIPAFIKPYLSDEDTRTLMIRSELILYTATSVMVDAVYFNKPILFLRKTTTNTIYFEPFFPNAIIDTCEDLSKFMSIFIIDKENHTYTQHERDIFLTTFGANSKNTLSEYADHILKI